MKKILLVPLCCITLLGCGNPNVTPHNIYVDNQLFDINMRTYINGGNQIVKASINDSSNTNYLIYLVDMNGVVTNSATTSRNKEVTFNNVKTDSRLYASKAFSSSLVETGISPKMINNLYPDYYNYDDNGTYSDKVEAKIEELKSNNDYTIEDPLMIYNAYGTDELSMYFYYNSDETTSVQYQVVTSNHQIYTRTVLDDFNGDASYTKEHEFTVHGMIPGETNYILVNSYFLGNIVDSHYISYKPRSLAEMDKDYVGRKIKKERLSSSPLSDGLFAFSIGVNTRESYRFTHTIMLDNNGDARWFVPMNDFYFTNIFIQNYNGENCLVYVIDYHQLVFVNYLGQTKKIITLKCPEGFREGKYDYFAMHHDFCFDDDNNILLLADPFEATYFNKEDDIIPTRTKYKYIIKYDINTGDITVPLYIDKCIFTNYQIFAKEQYSSYPEDWFHVNTIQFINENDGDYLTLSSRESSAVLRVKLEDEWESEDDIPATMPSIKWVLTGNKNIKTLEPGLTYLTNIEGGAIALPNLGQHTTYIIKENIFPTPLGPNQYYLAMFSNNSNANNSGNIWDYTGVSQKEKDTINKYSKNRIYLIDESTNKYEVIYDSNVSPFCAWMSSFTYFRGHWISNCILNINIVEKDLFGNELFHISIDGVRNYRTLKINL